MLLNVAKSREVVFSKCGPDCNENSSDGIKQGKIPVVRQNRPTRGKRHFNCIGDRQRNSPSLAVLYRSLTVAGMPGGCIWVRVHSLLTKAVGARPPRVFASVVPSFHLDRPKN